MSMPRPKADPEFCKFPYIIKRLYLQKGSKKFLGRRQSKNNNLKSYDID